MPKTSGVTRRTARDEVTKLKANYLSLTGYRLPTEAEMEYATRAGAVTSRYYGETEELLAKYAWYVKNSERPELAGGEPEAERFGVVRHARQCLVLVPGELQGLSQGQDAKAVEDNEDIQDVNNEEGRVLRGGSFVNTPMYVRSAFRSRDVPAYRNVFIGFRPARTFTAE